MSVDVQPLEPGDEPWAEAFLERRMGGRHQARRGELLDAPSLPGFVARAGERPVGLLTYRPDDTAWELFCIAAEQPGRGAGTALLDALRIAATGAGCTRVWLVTTNDNLRALRFYQRRGFQLVAVHPDAVARSRALKPAIPLRGADGIPLRDELELEMVLPA